MAALTDAHVSRKIFRLSSFLETKFILESGFEFLLRGGVLNEGISDIDISILPCLVSHIRIFIRWG